MNFLHVEDLRQLTRAELQALAELVGISATGESERIVDGLEERYPTGSIHRIGPQHSHTTRWIFQRRNLRLLTRDEFELAGVSVTAASEQIIDRLTERYLDGAPMPNIHNETDGFLNIENLRLLSQTQLLSRDELRPLAELAGVSATGESEQIIDRLAEQYPNGMIPMPDNPGQTFTFSHSELDEFFNIENLRQLSLAELRAAAELAGVSATGEPVQIIKKLLDRYADGIPMPDDHQRARALLALDGQEESYAGAPSPCDSTTSSTDALECVRLLLYPAEDDSDVEPLSQNGSKIDKGKGKAKAVSRSPSPPFSNAELALPSGRSINKGKAKAAPRALSAPPLTRPEDDEDPVSDEEGAGSGYSSPQIKLDKGKGKATAVSPCSSGYSDAAAPHSVEAGPVAGPSNSNHQADSSKQLLSHDDNSGYEWSYVEELFLKFDTLADIYPVLSKKEQMLKDLRSLEAETRESRLLLDHAEKMLVDTVLSLFRNATYRETLETMYMTLLKEYPEWRDGTAQLPKQDRKMRMRLIRHTRYEKRQAHYRRLYSQCERDGQPKPVLDEHVFYTTEESDLATTPEHSDTEDRNMQGTVRGIGKRTRKAGRTSAISQVSSTMPVASASGTRSSRARQNGHVAVDDVQSASGRQTGRSKGGRVNNRRSSKVMEDDSEADDEDKSASRAASSQTKRRAGKTAKKAGAKKRKVEDRDGDEVHTDIDYPNKRARHSIFD
ncbi:hypothetical protein JVU11DRAFT_8240 [Chiua virens]|nr:hypothetical protein JVU11DRAFT_8240 [Chiua virens]